MWGIFAFKGSSMVVLCIALSMLPFIAIGVFSRSAILWRMEQVFVKDNNNNQNASLNVSSSSSSQFADLGKTSNFSEQELLNLDHILSAASFRNKTVIITTLNQAWAVPQEKNSSSMLELFLDSFKQGDGISSFLDHLVIVALDKIAYDRCIQAHKHCFVLKTDGIDFSSEKFFMSEDYLKMMWRRVYFLGVVLKLGYNFIFSDADILWFRDPFKHFHLETDFEIACDQFYGSAVDLRNKPNGGFVHVRSNNRTIALYDYWYKARLVYPGKHDQDVLNAVKLKNEFWEIGLKMRFLTTQFFGGFCQVSRDLEEVCTMHANCCTGLKRKINDLMLVVADWKRFSTMSLSVRRQQRVYWRAPRECLHSFHS